MAKVHTIYVSNLKPGMELAESIFMTNDSGMQLMLIREGAHVDARILEILNNKGIESVRVFETSHMRNKTAAKRTAEMAIENQSGQWVSRRRPDILLPQTEIKDIITDEFRKEAVDSIRSLFTSLEGANDNLTTAYQSVNEFESVLTQLVEVATADIGGLIHVQNLKSYDEYTYHHSMSVALLSVATGQSMGLDSEQLKKLGRAAMLHDVGKQFIPTEIINKSGRLTEEEFKIIQDHPYKGMFNLKKNSFGDMEIWGGVLFHHEKVDGSGYPSKLIGEKIPLFAKIISVADVYDAVTSYRPYRSPMPPANAHELICAQVETAFEFDIVKAFFTRLELYPVGTIVELSDGKVGTVIDNKVNLRPVIKLYETDEEFDLASVKNLTYSISKVLNPNEEKL